MDIDITRGEMSETTARKVLAWLTQREGLDDRLGVKSYALRLLSVWKAKFTLPKRHNEKGHAAVGETERLEDSLAEKRSTESSKRRNSSGSPSSSESGESGSSPPKRSRGAAAMVLLDTPVKKHTD